MKRNSTPFLILLSCFLSSTALKAQLKVSFTVSADTICTSVAEHFVNTTTGGVKPYRELWIFGDGDTSTNGAPSHVYGAGSYKATLIVLDATFDTASASKTITVVALPKPNLGPDQRGCWGHPIMLTTGLPHGPVVKWLWILGKDTVSTFHGDTIMVADSGIYVVTVQNSAGCTGSDTANVYFNPPVKANQVDSTVCFNATVTLKAGAGSSGASYLWIDKIHNNTTVATTPTYTFTANASSGYAVQADLAIVIKVTGHGVTCVDTGYYNITVNTPTHPMLTAPKALCITDPAVQLASSLVDPLHQGGNWIYPRKPSAIVNNFLYPSVMGVTSNDPSLGWIHYIYVNSFKCITNDSVRISIYPLPTVSAGHDTEICIANGRYMLSNSEVSPPGGAWFGWAGTPTDAILYSKNLDSVFFDPSAAGIKADAVYAVIYDYKAAGSAPCGNSDTVYIKVVHSPNPYWTMDYIGNEAYFHAQDSSMAGSAYHWDFGDGDSAVGSSPKHLYASNKNYAVSLHVLVAAGCSNSLDSTITITKSGIKTSSVDNYSVDVYPNPFSSSAAIHYTINKPSKVTIGLFDIAGKQIAQIVNQTKAPGSYQAEINTGKYHLTPGVYFLKFMTEDGFVSRQIIKL